MQFPEPVLGGTEKIRFMLGANKGCKGTLRFSPPWPPPRPPAYPPFPAKVPGLTRGAQKG